MEQDDRSFTVEALYRRGKKLNTSGGRYINKTPSEAAKKAFSQYYRGKSGKMTLEVHIKETTNDSSNKIFKYKISKVVKNKKVERDGKMITYKYETIIKSL
jgi:predicted flavoprotein YhiN